MKAETKLKTKNWLIPFLILHEKSTRLCLENLPPVETRNRAVFKNTAELHSCAFISSFGRHKYKKFSFALRHFVSIYRYTGNATWSTETMERKRKMNYSSYEKTMYLCGYNLVRAASTNSNSYLQSFVIRHIGTEPSLISRNVLTYTRRCVSQDT